MKARLKMAASRCSETRALHGIVISLLYAWTLLFIAVPVDQTLGLSYVDVEVYGKNCSSLDSCDSRRTGSRALDGSNERNCACDIKCAEFGDCCVDAREQPRMSNTSHSWKCYELRQFGGVYLKDACPTTWQGPVEFKKLCEQVDTEDFSDPLGSMPVTNSETGATYRNYYCALCNGDNNKLVLWTPRLECPTLTAYNNSRKNLSEEYVFQNLVYEDVEYKTWGVFLDGDNGSTYFHDCIIDPVMPTLLESKIRLCKTPLISSCAYDWKEEDVSDKCASYMGVVYVLNVGYKNVHCAICNRVNLTLLSCRSVKYREGLIFRTFEHHAFSLLLDINENHGQVVGLVQRCAYGEVFDPFFKRCRSIMCLPGHERRGNRCIPRQYVPSKSDPVVPVTDDESKPTKSNVSVTNTSHIGDDLLNLITDHTPVNYTEVRNITEIVEPDELENITEIAELDEVENITEITELENSTDSVSYNVSDTDGNSPFPTENIDEKIKKFKKCFLISLADEDYIIYGNRSIYVPQYDRLYEPENYFTTDGAVLVCSHFEQEPESKFLPLMGYVTVIGLGISMLCLLLHCIVFLVVPDLQNLSGKNLVSQSISLFFAYCCFIIGQLDTLDFPSCTAIAFLTFFFFQVSFFWMSIMAFDVWRTLKMATTELRVSNGKQWKRFGAYSFYSWVTPLIIITISALAEYTDLFPEDFRPGFAQPRCWFKRRRALLVFFATPLVAIVIANIILFISSARMIIMTTKTTAKQQSMSQKRNFKLYLRLALLMGLTWTTGLVAGYVDVEFLWYVFVVLNTLQGLFIFIAFSCTTKVWNYLKDRFSAYIRSSDYRSSVLNSGSGSGYNTNSTNLSRKSSSRVSGPTSKTVPSLTSARPDAAYY